MTDGLAVHDSIREIVSRGCEVTIVVQGMAYSMGSVLLQAASAGRRLAFPHAWIMIHEPAKWAGWQSTTAAQHHLDRLRQMQDQIYRILAKRSGRPLKQIIRDTRRTDFYLDARKALAYGLIDAVVESAADAEPVGARRSRCGTASGRTRRRRPGCIGRQSGHAGAVRRPSARPCRRSPNPAVAPAATRPPEGGHYGDHAPLPTGSAGPSVSRSRVVPGFSRA